MSKGKTIQRDKTLIESVIENSKEIVSIKNVIHLLRMTIFAGSKCMYRLIDRSRIKEDLEEYRTRVAELEIHTANMLKAAYSHQFEMKFNAFHLTTAEMQAGHTTFSKGDKEVVLFLADCTPHFLETIKEGTLVELTDSIERDYLPNCTPVWKPNSLNDLYLEHLKLCIK